MSENTNNENVVPAKLVDEETVIPARTSVFAKETVDELVEKHEEDSKPKNDEDESIEEIEDVVEESTAIVSLVESEEKPGLAYVENGVLGSTKVKPSAPKPVVKKAQKKEETVAIYSSRNVTWNGVGKVYIGYNIVSKAVAEQWLKRDHTRLATPEEVAKEFGL
jgi:DNA-binding protein H-NS